MNFPSFGSRRGPDLAIDLGTANMRIMVRGEGVVFDEPSLCYYEKTAGQMKLIAAGRDVLAMVDRVPGTHVVRRPLARGVLQDIDAAAALLAHGLSSVVGRKRRGRPPALIQKENINFACDITYSQVVTHLSTNMTKCSLNSLIGKHRPN